MLGDQPDQPAELGGLQPGDRNDSLWAGRRDHLHFAMIHHGPVAELREVHQLAC
jgi:hypothetical protein